APRHTPGTHSACQQTDPRAASSLKPEACSHARPIEIQDQRLFMLGTVICARPAFQRDGRWLIREAQRMRAVYHDRETALYGIVCARRENFVLPARPHPGFVDSTAIV